MLGAFFDWLQQRKLQRHIWVRIPRVEEEVEIFHTNIDAKYKELLCKAFNLIEDNAHEGAGWWEKVDVVKTVNFDNATLSSICGKNCSRFKTANFPRIYGGEVTTTFTFLPKEVLTDISKAPGKVIGFNPHKTAFREPHTTVWIHYMKPTTSR